MRFKLTVLGCSSALPTISKHQTAHVLNVHEQFYLIDCGEGVQKQLKRYDINILKINHIFISHLHGDHVFGLFGLISSMKLLGRTRVLEIFAPDPILEIVDNHLRLFCKGMPYKIIAHTLDTKKSNVIYETNALSVESIPLKHSVPTVGFLFKEKSPELNIQKLAIKKHDLTLSEIVALKRGENIERASGEIIKSAEVAYIPYQPRSFAYCCDTAYAEKIVSKIEGVDMLMHETTYLKSDKKFAKKYLHSTTSDAAAIANLAMVKKLIITHFSTRYKTSIETFLDETKELFENSYLAREGSEFEIPLVTFKK